jgi:hypothetical protein
MRNDFEIPGKELPAMRVNRKKAALVTLAAAVALAAGVPAGAQHPGPVSRPGPSMQWQSADLGTTFVVTPEGQYPSVDPFLEPPGSNFLFTVYENARDGNGVEMVNTLPSTPDVPYNLHDGPVVTTSIPTDSPSTDLRALFNHILHSAKEGKTIDYSAIDRAIDIIEGNPIPNRPWSGLPLLHYKGPEKVKKVVPIYDALGNKIGGNVDVYQAWFDSHIESNAAFIDPSEVLDVPWTITYTVDCLHRCHDDFSPFVMYFDDPALSPPGMPPMPHVAMDQTFFPMEDGTRNVFKLKMTPGKYYNLTYTWGWRLHPPRVQVTENARKVMGGKTLPQWEIDTFGPAPTSSEAAKLAAIAKIGDLAPAKQMWRLLRSARAVDSSHMQVAMYMKEVLDHLDDWLDRTELPKTVRHLVDPGADVTLFYVNNTIYGKVRNGGWDDIPGWNQRPYTYKAKLLNGDYFMHGYMNVDFGGSRGWENQFQSSVGINGIGCKFSFGRTHWWVNAGGPWGAIVVPPANPADITSVGQHRVEITLNFEPSRRLRLYQFDPLHHDVAVYSLH